MSTPVPAPARATEADPIPGSASVVRRWPAPDTEPALVLVRHGETEWSRSGQHTGNSDIALTARGEQQARAAGPLIRGVLGSAEPVLVLSSPRQRARRTAELAGFEVDDTVADAAEWDYGDLEGRTSAEIGQQWPDWSVWSGPVPGGEDAAAVTSRFDRLLATIASRLAAGGRAGPVLVFSHGHAIRCLAARWLGVPVTSGRHFWLGTGAVSPSVTPTASRRCCTGTSTATHQPEHRGPPMTADGRLAASGTVELTVPADPAYLSVLRTVIASLAAGQDFTLDEIDDLRIAVDEAGALLLPHAESGSQVSAVFDVGAGTLRAEVAVTMPAGRVAEPDRSGFAWLVLTALTDSVEWVRSGQRLALVLTKDRGTRDR